MLITLVLFNVSNLFFKVALALLKTTLAADSLVLESLT